MRLDSRFDSPDHSTGLVLWQVTNRWQAAQRAALRPFGLTHVQFVLLASLTWYPEAMTQKQLAEHAATDPMMTSQVLRVLEGRSLVHREAHPTDGRAILLSVTDAGRYLANQAIAVVEACDTAFFAALGPDQARFTTDLVTLRHGKR